MSPKYEINPPTRAAELNRINTCVLQFISKQQHKGLLPYLSINLHEEINNNYRPFLMLIEEECTLLFFNRYFICFDLLNYNFVIKLQR